MFLVAGIGSAASQTDWLEKDAWNEKPNYAENISIDYKATDRIRERISKKTCTTENTTSENTTFCKNESFKGQKVSIFKFDSSNNDYLGNGNVRTNLVIGLNDLSLNTLMETTFLMSESEYINWFNKNYYYENGNITSSKLDSLQQNIQNMYTDGSNTNIKAAKINSYTITSLYPFRAEANTTMVFKFNDFRSGSFKVSDLVTVEVSSSLEN